MEPDDVYIWLREGPGVFPVCVNWVMLLWFLITDAVIAPESGHVSVVVQGMTYTDVLINPWRKIKV